MQLGKNGLDKCLKQEKHDIKVFSPHEQGLQHTILSVVSVLQASSPQYCPWQVQVQTSKLASKEGSSTAEEKAYIFRIDF